MILEETIKKTFRLPSFVQFNTGWGSCYTGNRDRVTGVSNEE